MAEADSQESGPSELVVANFPEEQKPLVCIEYPGWSKACSSCCTIVEYVRGGVVVEYCHFAGFVDNVDRAIDSLGGSQAISQV